MTFRACNIVIAESSPNYGLRWQRGPEIFELYLEPTDTLTIKIK